MFLPMPTPGLVRAIRLPADGTPPHPIILETYITGPPQHPPDMRQSYYRTMLEYLMDHDRTRHVPNIHVFWTPIAWELRDIVKVRYTNEIRPSLSGRYSLYMTDSKEDTLLRNPFITNQNFTYFGDAFILKENTSSSSREGSNDVMSCLLELRHEHIYPKYEDVPEGILDSDLLHFIVTVGFRDDFLPEGPIVGEVYGSIPVSPSSVS